MNSDILAHAQERLSSVRANIDRAARVARRTPADIALIAVSKTKTADEISPVGEIGSGSGATT